MDYSDPFGLYAKVVVNGNHVYITIPITYSGPGSLLPGLTDSWNMSISNAWTGQFGQYNVSTIVTDGSENQIFVSCTAGFANVNPAGHNGGIWPAFGDPRAPPHEAGHLMGLQDEYWRWSGQPVLGYEHDIMGVLGQPPSERDITEIINWSQGRP